MRPHEGIETFVFPDETAVLAAVQILIRSGVGPSRLSIHLWGREFALRTLDDISVVYEDELFALGARLSRDGIRPVNRGASASSMGGAGTPFPSAAAS